MNSGARIQDLLTKHTDTLTVETESKPPINALANVRIPRKRWQAQDSPASTEK